MAPDLAPAYYERSEFDWKLRILLQIDLQNSRKSRILRRRRQ